MNEDIKDLKFWLGGLFDGEGHITKRIDKRRPHVRICELVVVNTDFGLIQKCKEIFDYLGIEYHIHERRRTNPNWKQVYDIRITKHDSALKFAREIPLFSQKKVIELKKLIEYINQSRISKTIDSESLRRLYWQDKLSLCEISKQLGFKDKGSWIVKLMQRYDIPRRTVAEGMKLSWQYRGV